LGAPPSVGSVAVQLLRQGTPIRFAAAGRSMGPTISDGDVVEVVPLGDAPPRTGDIVLLEGRAGPLIHRVVRSPRNRSGSYSTQGDASFWPDDPVPPTAIVGRVVAIERCGRRVRPVRMATWLALGRSWLRRLRHRRPAAP
jgi:hypothetical protein